MEAIRIKVLKRALHPDIAREWGGREIGPCEIFTDGQEFITGLNKPEGFCDWAWKDIHGVVLSLLNGGSFNTGVFQGWMKNPGSMIACCTDGVRPVSFLLEKVETTALIDREGVMDPAPQSVYGSERWGDFTYTIKGLGPGKACKVRLHFAEIFFNAPHRRLFHIDVNGKRQLENFDIYAEAGGAFKALIHEFDCLSDSTGKITLSFVKGLADMPKISAIEVLPGIKINCGGSKEGSFEADQDYTGGNVFGG